ncbi:MAG: sigma-70 family RNA polymerase sigma factor [Gemmataceae bacterium]
MGDDIATLIAAARSGDSAARERLFARCRDYLGLAARSRVESWLRAKVDASDLVQQTMLDAHCGFAAFRGGTEAEWLAWLRMILDRNATDFVRHYRTAGRAAGREAVMESDPVAAGDSPSSAAIRQEGELQLAEALSRLSEDHRTVIELRNLQRLPFDQVAARLGRSRPAVQMLWMRAMQRLQAEMV